MCRQRPLSRALQALLILSISTSAFLAGPIADGQAAPVSNRKVLLIPGLNSSTGAARDTFKEVIRTLSTPDVGLRDADFLSFSYSPKVFHDRIASPSGYPYGPDDTHDVWVPRLNIYTFLDAYPNDSFDIVTHSLGGVVALLWVAEAARERPEYLARIHSITTLDSPVAGLGTMRYWISVMQTYMDLGALPAELDRESEIIDAIQSGVGAVNVATLGNTNDLIVKPEEAALAGASSSAVWDAGVTGPNSEGECGAVLAVNLHDFFTVFQ